MRSALILLALLLSTAIISQAQDECTSQRQLAFSRGYAACQSVERNEVCYGGGNTIPGEVVSLNALENISLTSDETWSTAFLRLQANLTASSQRSVFGILYGNALLTNHIAPLPQVRLIPRGRVNIRTAPDQSAEIVAQVGINGTLTANGQNAEGEWLRVIVPNTDQLGWVNTQIVTPEDDTITPNTVSTDSRLPQPFESMTLDTRVVPPCEETPQSGLLLQTPNLEDSVRLIINDATFDFVGTLLLQVDGSTLTVDQLEGTATIADQRLAAGARLQIFADNTSAVTSYDQAAATLSPTLYLPRRVQLLTPLTSSQLTDLSTAPTATPTTTDAPVDVPCTYRVVGDQNIRVEPRVDTGIARSITAGTLIFPRAQTTDEQGRVWVQVGQQAWLRASALTIEGDCSPLPTIETEFITSVSTNTVPLEECQPSNGTVTVGQQVTLTFVPPAWENYPAALEATRASRGRILINDDNLYPSVSDPVRISDNEYIRQFTVVWTAELGTYRIEGSHFAYEVICTITVVPE